MDETLRQWGENIRLRRMAMKMKQEDLGALLTPKVTQGTVARWERGLMEPRRHYKSQLAAALHTDVRLLFPLTQGAA